MQSWKGLDLKELWPSFGAVSVWGSRAHPGVHWAAQSWVWTQQSSPDEKGRLWKCREEHELGQRGGNPAQTSLRITQQWDITRDPSGLWKAGTGWAMFSHCPTQTQFPFPSLLTGAGHRKDFITAGENPWVGARGAGIRSHFIPMMPHVQLFSFSGCVLL